MSPRKLALKILIFIGSAHLVGCGGYAPSIPKTTPPPNVAARFALVANFSSNSISSYAIDPQTGQLTPKATVPTGGFHARVIAAERSGNFVYVGNFASNDISTFAIDANTGDLAMVDSPVPAGGGPRFIVI